MAVEMPNNGDWIYKAMEPNPSGRDGRIVVRVTDSPGNVVTTFHVIEG
jgi:hypothetical protein